MQACTWPAFPNMGGLELRNGNGYVPWTRFVRFCDRPRQRISYLVPGQGQQGTPVTLYGAMCFNGVSVCLSVRW